MAQPGHQRNTRQRRVILEELQRLDSHPGAAELYEIVRERAHVHGGTVLTVLHDLNLAAEYCDRVYMLREGRIEAAGPTAEAFTYTNLTRVFDTEVYVDTNALTGKLLVVPLSARARERSGGGDG